MLVCECGILCHSVCSSNYVSGCGKFPMMWQTFLWSPEFPYTQAYGQLLFELLTIFFIFIHNTDLFADLPQISLFTFLEERIHSMKLDIV